MVELESEQDVQNALEKHRRYLGQRYVEGMLYSDSFCFLSHQPCPDKIIDNEMKFPENESNKTENDQISQQLFAPWRVQELKREGHYFKRDVTALR